MSAPPLLSIRNLGVSYWNSGTRVPALDGISLDLEPGRRLAVIGESGSGKSTLAHAVAGILPPSAAVTGSIAFPALREAPKLGRDIGMVFQDPSGSLDPVMTVGDQIAEIVVTHEGRSWRDGRARAVELLDRVRIPDARRRVRSYPHEFSGGQRQRIAIAAALAGDPRLLIADEPTSALDTVVQRELISVFDDLTRAGRLTLLFVTHDIALASEIADDLAVLFAGRVVESGPAMAIFRSPAHAYTRALLATRLDLEAPVAARLPVIEGPDFAVRVPEPAV